MSEKGTERIEAQLKRLVPFAAIISAPDFRMGEIVMPSLAPGVFQFPHYSFSAPARAFIDQCYELEVVLGDFDWAQWIQSPEGRQLCDSRQALANASAEQVAKLLTALVRQERFSEGALGDAHKSGLLSALLERVAAMR